MKLKLDENLSKHLQAALQQLGHDVSTACDEGLLGRSDSYRRSRHQRAASSYSSVASIGMPAAAHASQSRLELTT